ncbi:MAG TPA: VOC family protein [Candidatus Saccharimonadales bacterium]|nr:VOC family protein [Candidatus Saccharimonadales bacterium]
MNPVTWFSIPADDIEQAKDFYNKAFGWEIQPETKEADDRYSFNIALTTPDNDAEFNPTKPAIVNGCIVKKAIGVTTPVVLLQVEDLDAAMQRVKTAGGSIVSEKIPMGSLNGSFVLVKDPEGNMLELFASN